MPSAEDNTHHSSNTNHKIHRIDEERKMDGAFLIENSSVPVAGRREGFQERISVRCKDGLSKSEL